MSVSVSSGGTPPAVPNAERGAALGRRRGRTRPPRAGSGGEAATQWARVLWLDASIRDREYPSLRRLQEQFEVSRRTACNDIAFLRDSLNAPVRHNRVRGGYEYEDPTYALPSVFLEEGELLALLLAEEVARSYVGTALEEPLQRALAKLRRYLPDTITVNLDEAAAAYHFRELSRLEAPLERMRDLQRAVRERRVVWIRYRSPRADAETEREIEPHFFAHVGGDCMLVAWDRLRDAVRAFLPGRILDHAVREARFRRRPELSAETYSASAFLTEHGDQPFEVVLRFDAYQARWIRERRWHPSQVLEELPDGGVLMRLRVSGDGDLLRWVLGYGSHVEIVSPAWLRDRAVAELEATLALYRRAGAEQLTER